MGWSAVCTVLWKGTVAPEEVTFILQHREVTVGLDIHLGDLRVVVGGREDDAGACSAQSACHFLG
jgi:hypothetical protein